MGNSVEGAIKQWMLGFLSTESKRPLLFIRIFTVQFISFSPLVWIMLLNRFGDRFVHISILCK